jgi:phosphate transport system substrate-binding protein
MLVAALACCIGLTSCSDLDDDLTLQGAGATFPGPLYKRWFLEYYKRNPRVRVNYQAIGSGAGIRQFTARNVDFGASDAAMSDDEIKKVDAAEHKKGREGVQLLPMTAGSIAVSYNLPSGPSELRLSRKALVDIFLGEITSWNDAAIAQCNPGVTLPDLDITVIRRSEGSGTTFAFSNHLTAISDTWKNEVGASKTVDKWKTGIGAKGNAGVAALIQQTPGAIGYIEAGFAELTHLPMAAIENKAGAFMMPTAESAQAALADAKLPENLRLFITDPPGKEAYPIVTYTWILCFKKYSDAKTSRALREVLKFCLTEGQQWSKELGYVPLPEKVATRVLEAVDTIKP